MRALLLATVLLLALPPSASALPDYDGDGVLAPADCDPLDGAIAPGKPDAPDLAFEDADCDGIDGTEAGAIFVAPGGDDAAPGTRAAPKATMQAAVDAAEAAARDVYAAAGTFTGPVMLADGVGVHGGYDAVAWQRSLANVTRIEGNPNAALADDDQGVVLQLLELAGSATGGGASAYGLRAINGSTVSLTRVTAAAAGVPGGTNPVAPDQPEQAPEGGDGMDASCVATMNRQGGPSTAADVPGGKGGDGRNGLSGLDGSPGAPGVNGGAAGGGGPVGAIGGPGGPGGDGDPGFDAAPAEGGTFTDALAGATWVGDDGDAGMAGTNGEGGGGGGGGGGGNVVIGVQETAAGGGGGAGGSGGRGGPGGPGGGPGGGSFGLYVFDSSVVATESVLRAGEGGPGGDGADGAPGGPGGDPGTPGLPATCIDMLHGAGGGGTGGDGGDGGNGGHGGGGSGGPSYGVFRIGTTGAFTDRSSTEEHASGGIGGLNAFSRAENGQAAPVRELNADAPADFDGDGVGDDADDCPDVAGAAPSGCPARPPKLPDDDGDQIPNGSDLCPAVPRDNDANEDGCPDALPGSPPPPPPGPPPRPGATRIDAKLGQAGRYRRRGTRFSRLALRGVPAGARVIARCRTKGGKRCKGTRAFAAIGTGGPVRLGPFLRKRLPPGAVIDIRATRGDKIGAVLLIRIRKAAPPRVLSLCLPPGGTRPQRTC